MGTTAFHLSTLLILITVPGAGVLLGQPSNVRAWGNNYYGQLGNGMDEQVVSRSVPERLGALSDIVKIAAGQDHTLAVKSDGTVWAWGNNVYGELGNGHNTDSNIPVRVSGLTNVVDVAAGGGFGEHSLALKSDGTVWAWGNNTSGELGHGGGGFYSNVPVQASGLTGVLAIAANASHSVALKRDGTVWAWGFGFQAGLGDGSNQSVLPARVNGLSGVVGIAAGADHNLALKSDGTVWAWGDNSYGQLGNGSSYSSDIPVQVSGLTGVIAIAGGWYHSLALRGEGTVWVWGEDFNGQLGTGVAYPGGMSSVPVPVSALTGVIAIAGGGGYSVIGETYGHSLALKADGTVWAWGNNDFGQLGNAGGQHSNTPVAVRGLDGVTAIAGGGAYNVALKSDRTIYLWGDNKHGQLGNGTSAESDIPVPVSGLTSAVAISGGSDFSMALDSDGTVWAWGNNANGQLGDGKTANSNVPVQVSGLTGVVGISAGYQNGLAVKSDGTAWGWEQPAYVDLGDGSKVKYSVPIQVSGLTDMVAVAGGGRFSLALKRDGRVWAWGDNSEGELGNSVPGYSFVPVLVTGLTGVVAIAAGASHSLALRSDGTVWAWGAANYGQLGNGTLFETHSSVPAQVKDLTGVVAIAGGVTFSLALKSDGTVWIWGGYFGANKALPVQVTGLANVLAISGGNVNSSALKSDGTVWAWGHNYYGDLGDGTNADSTVPVRVTGLTGVVTIASGENHTLAALAGNIPELALTPATLNFAGNGTQTITVSNHGSAPLLISDVVLTGINPGDFLVSGTCSRLSLAPAQSCVLKVTFAPLLQGSRTAALFILANAPGSPIVIPLSGTGTASSCARSITPSELSVDSTGGRFTIALAADSSCAWVVSGLPSWITVSPVSGSGSAALTFTVASDTELSRSATTLIASVPVAVSQSGVLSINAGGVVNSASYTSPVAPGSIVSVFGSFLQDTPLPGLSLVIGFDSVPLFYGSARQLTAQIPWETPESADLPVSVTLSGQTSAYQRVQTVKYAPGIFAINGQGTGQGAIVDTGYHLVDSTNPATAGSSVIQIYCTGLGPVTNQPATGAPAPSDPLAATTTIPTVTIGDAPATVLFSGLAPGFVGEYQVNVLVPLASAKGIAVPVVISMGGVASNTVTIGVH